MDLFRKFWGGELFLLKFIIKYYIIFCIFLGLSIYGGLLICFSFDILGDFFLYKIFKFCWYNIFKKKNEFFGIMVLYFINKLRFCMY